MIDSNFQFTTAKIEILNGITSFEISNYNIRQLIPTFPYHPPLILLICIMLPTLPPIEIRFSSTSIEIPAHLHCYHTSQQRIPLSSANPSNLLNQSLNTHPSTQGSSLVSLPSLIFFFNIPENQPTVTYIPYQYQLNLNISTITNQNGSLPPTMIHIYEITP